LKTRDERQAAGIGDCIECGYCVQVCPTGIDIRNGLQLQCISCALCVDACDAIMDQLHWPRGLIQYTSENAQNGLETRLIKPKTLGYGVVLCAAVAALTWSILTGAAYTATVEQIRQPLFVTLSDGRIQNTYEIKLNNKRAETATFGITLDKLPGAELDLEGLEDRVTLNPQQRLRVLARVRMAPPGTGENQHHYEFVITPLEGMDAPPVREPTLFYTPG
jgi:cytochrome c oxidase accessory protein FixG